MCLRHTTKAFYFAFYGLFPWLWKENTLCHFLTSPARLARPHAPAGIPYACPGIPGMDGSASFPAPCFTGGHRNPCPINQSACMPFPLQPGRPAHAFRTHAFHLLSKEIPGWFHGSIRTLPGCFFHSPCKM